MTLVAGVDSYGALGAATQGAWASSGSRPGWATRIAAEPAADDREIIRGQYRARSERAPS